MAGRQSEYQPDICQELAFAYSEKGLTDEALAWLDKTDNMDCDHNNIQVIKGHVLIAAKRIHEGLEQYRQAVLNSDDMSKTTLRIVVSLYDNKYPSIAYLLFKKFYLALNNNDDDGEGYAYMALCCFDLKKTDEFLEYLEKACQRNPKECKLVLGHLFPENVEPQNYYNYIKEKMKL
jgi:tetratricopeptide (TPR) repeat protein